MTTIPPDSTISSTITKDVSWLRHHLLVVAVLGLFIFGGVYGVENLIAKHDSATASRYEALAAQLVQQNQVIQQQTKAQIDALTQQNVALQQEIGTLATAITARDAQLKTTQAQVPQLPPSQLSAEWQARIKNAGSVKPNLGGYLVDQSAAVATLQALEAVPVLEQDKADLEKINATLQTQFNNEVQIYQNEVKSHNSDNATNKGTIDARNAEILQIKSDARKGKLKWFAIGFIAGRVSAFFGL